MVTDDLDNYPPYWETEEYREAECELDTYNDPARLVMEYRESEKQKDHELAVMKNALELACETFCSGSHPEIRLEIQNYALISGVIKYFIKKAKEKLKDEINND